MIELSNVLVVYKKSVFDLYSNSPDETVKTFVTNGSKDAVEMRRSHDEQQRTLDTVISVLKGSGIEPEVKYRAELEGTIAGKELVITVGGDGTLLDVSHYVGGTPMLGVNSDTTNSKGFYCTADRTDVEHILSNLQHLPRTRLYRLELVLNGTKLPMPVLNDIMIAHTNPAASTSYELTANKESRIYKGSYGLFVCTPSGSTGAMWNEGGKLMPLSMDFMQYHPRGYRKGEFHYTKELQIRSRTREGIVFIDGQHIKHPFTLDDTLVVRIGQKLTLIGDLEKKRAEYYLQLRQEDASGK